MYEEAPRVLLFASITAFFDAFKKRVLLSARVMVSEILLNVVISRVILIVSSLITSITSLVVNATSALAPPVLGLVLYMLKRVKSVVVMSGKKEQDTYTILLVKSRRQYRSCKPSFMGWLLLITPLLKLWGKS